MIRTDLNETTPDVPESLIYEVSDGRPLYYTGYRDVLAGQCSSEAIRFGTGLQSLLASLIFGHLSQCLDCTQFQLLAGNPGLRIDKRNVLTNSLAVYAKHHLTRLSNDYFTVPPVVTVEIDIRVDAGHLTDGSLGYIAEKTQRLFDFSVERVFWVLSKSRRVFVAVPNQNWIFTDWSNDVAVMDGCVLNVKRLLDEEEISY